MLILDRQIGEQVFIGQSLDGILSGQFIRVTLIRIKPKGSVAIGFDATKDTFVVRESVLKEMAIGAGRNYDALGERAAESVCACPTCGRTSDE